MARHARLRIGITVVVDGRLFAKAPQAWRLHWHQEPVGAQATVGSEGHFRIRGVRDERGSLLARSADLTRLAYLEDVDPRDGPFELRPVNAQTIAELWIGVVIQDRVEGVDHMTTDLVLRASD